MTDKRGNSGTENELKGKAKELGGKIRGEVGDMTDNHSEEVKGKKLELEGKAQKKLGEAQNALD